MFGNHKLRTSIYCIFTYALSASSLVACGQKNKTYQSPPGYNLNKPFVVKLPSELFEISGMAYYKKDNSLFVESDNKGAVYKIFLNNVKDIRKWKFGQKRNYEDILFHDSVFYVINDDGDITALRFLNDSFVTSECKFPEKGNFEFETLYFDDKLQKMILICKDCETDKKTAVSTYEFDPQTCTYSNSYTIDAGTIVEKDGPKTIKFKPSAAAVNPASGELYILSSVNKLLVVMDSSRKIKESYKLDAAIFNHPEGLTFTPDGSMFISNEGDNLSPATILYFKKTGNR
ncbi:MAG: hypothetical protein JWM28_1902 [Chitinophagaceae bacterium]|nr:hypothetical protein [Chitinophagaceae bacterium]